MKIFITGATSGIGLELTKLYLSEGHEVGICGRDLAKLPEELMTHMRLKSYQVDVADRLKLVEAINDFALDTKGEMRLDLVVANAGRSVGEKGALPNWEAGHEVLKTNVFGFYYTFEAALAIMLKQGSGHLVAISSVAGFIGVPGAAAYSASKAAVTKFCETLMIDLKAYNIDVTNICPGFIDTPLTRKNSHKMPFLISVEKGASKIKYAIACRKKNYIFPFPMKLGVIFLDKIPRSLYRYLIIKITAFVMSKRGSK